MPNKNPPSTSVPPVAMNHGVRDPQRVNRAMTDLVSDLRAAGIYGRNTGALDAAGSRIEDQVITDLRRLQRDSEEPVGAFIRNNILPDSYGAPERPALARLRDQQVAAPPQEYVVRYYAWSNPNQPRPQLVQETYSEGTDDSTHQHSHGDGEDSPLITRNNPMRPITADMRDDVQHAFATISSQLPGRFRFVEVNDPAQADIQVAAITNAEGFTGIASRTNGSVLLDLTEYNSRLHGDHENPQHAAWQRDQMRKAVMHEVLHAMGVTHPQDDNDYGTRYGAANKPVNQRATFFETVMTYSDNDDAGRGMGEWQVPVSLMPADLSALQRMYPVAGDRNGAVVGTAAGVERRSDIGATIGSGGATREVLMPDSGVVFQPQADSRADTVRLRTAGTATVQLQQNARGVMIGEPGLNTATYLQFSPEQIRTSPGNDLVTLRNNAAIHVERNGAAARDGVALYGSGNRISVPTENLGSTLFTLHGNNYHFTLRNEGAQFGQLPRIQIGNHSAQGMLRGWVRDEDGTYRVALRPAGSSQTVSFTFELADASPAALARMDALMTAAYGARQQARTAALDTPAPTPTSPEALRESLGINTLLAYQQTDGVSPLTSAPETTPAALRSGPATRDV